MKRLVILLFIFFMVVGFGTYNAVNKIKYREMQNRFRNFYSAFYLLIFYKNFDIINIRKGVDKNE